MAVGSPVLQNPTLAKTAIEGGKVQLAGQRVKVSREVSPGDSCVFAKVGMSVR